jgi:hypothetical protein
MIEARATDTQWATKLTVEEGARAINPQGGTMISEIPKFVTQARALHMLGISEAELLRISKESGLGHSECAGDEEETYFTYEELRRICAIASQFRQVDQ